MTKNDSTVSIFSELIPQKSRFVKKSRQNLGYFLLLFFFYHFALSSKGKQCLPCIITSPDDPSFSSSRNLYLRRNYLFEYSFPIDQSSSLFQQLQRNLDLVRVAEVLQPFVGGKNGHENFRDKCVVFAHNCKFANLTQ